MAVLVLDGGQSSTEINSQSTTYITQKIISQMPAMPDSLVQSVLQDVLQEFYTKSTGWRDVVGPYKVAVGRPELQLNPIDQYTKLKYVLQAWLFPGPGGGNTPQNLGISTRKIIGSDVNIPSTAWMRTPDRLVLYPVPDKDYGKTLYVYAVLMPVINTPQLPDIAISDHLDALQWGTMARLYRMPSKPWTNFELSKEHRRDYHREMMRIRDTANRSYSGTDTPVRFPAFAGPGSQGSQMGSRNSF